MAINSRLVGIGGSDAPAVCGVDKYKSMLELYFEKTGHPMEKKETVAMFLGKKFEWDVLNWFASETGKTCEGRFDDRVIHKEIEFMNCQVDGVIPEENAIIECKITTSSFSDLALGRVPENYIVQAHHNMEVHNASVCYLPYFVLDPKGPLKMGFHTIEKDSMLIKSIVSMEGNFWNEHVKKGIPPEFTGDLKAETLASLYPEEKKGLVVYLDQSFNEKAMRLDSLKYEIKKMQEERVSIENDIKKAMGDAEISEVPEFRFVWSSQSRDSINAELLKAKYPEIYKECLKQTQTRVFRSKQIEY